MSLNSYLPGELLDAYEVHNFRHAAEVLASGCADEFAQFIDALLHFHITMDDIKTPGGNESQIPKRMASLLRPVGWFETRIRGNLVMTIESHTDQGIQSRDETLENFVDGHKIDFVKNRVAFDMEWNSKDQTFDRDLFAFRAFHDAGVISAAILLTRSAEMNPLFKELGLMSKYGASTTWMGKLLYRIRAGRAGGCPVLVLGITPKVIKDHGR